MTKTRLSKRKDWDLLREMYGYTLDDDEWENFLSQPVDIQEGIIEDYLKSKKRKLREVV